MLHLQVLSCLYQLQAGCEGVGWVWACVWIGVGIGVDVGVKVGVNVRVNVGAWQLGPCEMGSSDEMPQLQRDLHLVYWSGRLVSTPEIFIFYYRCLCRVFKEWASIDMITLFNEFNYDYEYAGGC